MPLHLSPLIPQLECWNNGMVEYRKNGNSHHSSIAYQMAECLRTFESDHDMRMQLMRQIRLTDTTIWCNLSGQ